MSSMTVNNSSVQYLSQGVSRNNPERYARAQSRPSRGGIALERTVQGCQEIGNRIEEMVNRIQKQAIELKAISAEPKDPNTTESMKAFIQYQKSCALYQLKQLELATFRYIVNFSAKMEPLIPADSEPEIDFENSDNSYREPIDSSEKYLYMDSPFPPSLYPNVYFENPDNSYQEPIDSSEKHLYMDSPFPPSLYPNDYFENPDTSYQEPVYSQQGPYYREMFMSSLDPNAQQNFCCTHQ